VLARLDALKLLFQSYGRVGLTASVYTEVVTQGRAKAIPDALIVETTIENGHLTVLPLTAAENRLAGTFAARLRGLSRTDCETLACAKTRALTLLIEDRRARNAARAHAIPYLTIQVLPLYSLVNGKVSVQDCEQWLLKIGQAMQTDLAVVEALRAAIREIGRLRAKES
jgi:predicted nucleic acid-binding protein